jgi:YafQ family addiction module toxin component
LYSIEVEGRVKKIFSKLAKKDSKQLESINKKIVLISENPHQFKPLKFPLQNLRRVHIGSFVLVYGIDETRKAITIWDYEHHDEVYKK